MTWPTGVKPPLHRRFNEGEAIEMIQNRYKATRELIEDQVAKLQADEAFRAQCQEYYEDGYKDWAILAAILNCMMGWRAAQLRIDASGLAQFYSLESMSEQIRGNTYPAWRFVGDDMNNQLKLHAIVALESYGFQLRRPDVKHEVVERFLRERMNHYQLDLPHEPLFGEPPGDWPAL